jgi:predicted P-loop ATPase
MQGIYKSMGMATLCLDADWFCDDVGDLSKGKDAAEGLPGKWLVEFSEFSRIKRATSDVVKSFLSRRVDHYRAAYGHMAKDYPRQCFFVGTTNDRHPLHDEENRRFMPVECKLANMDWIRKNRDQLWAEAVQRFHDGEEWWVNGDSPALTAAITSHQDDARMHDEYESMIETVLLRTDETTIEWVAGELGIKRDRLDRFTQMRIGKVLGLLGFERSRSMVKGKRQYVYRRGRAIYR